MAPIPKRRPSSWVASRAAASASVAAASVITASTGAIRAMQLGAELARAAPAPPRDRSPRASARPSGRDSTSRGSSSPTSRTSATSRSSSALEPKVLNTVGRLTPAAAATAAIDVAHVAVAEEQLLGRGTGCADGSPAPARRAPRIGTPS